MKIPKGYTVKKSNKKLKKYDVYKDGKYLLSFGQKFYEQYYDIIGFYSNKNHLDKERRRLYYLRHGYTNDINSPKWWSSNFLWPLNI
jgi:hypothetical protein